MDITICAGVQLIKGMDQQKNYFKRENILIDKMV